MKKIVFFLAIFFWSMIFPSISFNQFTTEIYSQDIQYSNLFQKESRTQILKNAKFDFFLIE